MITTIVTFNNVENFRSMRDFYKKFPSRFYICSNCGYVNNNPYNCQKCSWRADGLFKTMGSGYRYSLENSSEVYEIFKPIELER